MVCVLYLTIIALLRVGLAVRKFDDEYPGVTVCESSLNIHYEYHMVDAYSYLKGFFGGIHNCTHVEGNLVIQKISPDDQDFSFLSSIQEVTGFVYLANNYISKVILPNLRVIRGASCVTETWYDEKSYCMSLYIDLINESFVEQAIFPSLKVISNNSVVFHSELPFKYLPDSIDWHELFENPKDQLLLKKNPTAANFSCDPSCATGTVVNIPNKCWSSSSSHCQARTKCKTSDQQWCYFRKLENKIMNISCSDRCSGGCTGQKNYQCTACKEYVDKEYCVISCASSKLRVGMMCASSCPVNLLEEKDGCVYKCKTPEYYRLENQCLPCENIQKCAKTDCDLEKYYNGSDNFFITKTILKDLAVCDHIIGELHLTKESFDRRQGGITIDMLYKYMKNIKFLTGDLKIDGTNMKLHNLTFLDNLQEIRHQQTFSSTSALNIFSTDLEFLGLRRLRMIYGDFSVVNNSNLCYLETLKWSNQILQTNQFQTSFDHCNKSCDQQCNSQYGCWGPSSSMCYHCNGVRAGSNCVARCEDEPGYYTNETNGNNTLLVYDDGSCKKCHWLCLQNCTGPGPDKCFGECRFLQEGNTCVVNCSESFYKKDKQCLPCNGNCVKSLLNEAVCTGGGSFMGPGGCSFCKILILNVPGSLMCHNDTRCPDKFYLSVMSSLQIRPNYPDQAIYMCFPCQAPCSKCLSNSTSRLHCTHCDGFWSDDDCVIKCETNRLTANQSLLPNDQCPYCDDQCQTGCHSAHNASQCMKCKNKLLHQSSNQKFPCVERCPPSQNYTYKNDATGDILCVDYFQWEKHEQQINRSFIRRIIFLSMIPFFILIFVVCCSLMRHLIARNKKKSINYLKAFYSNIQEPDSRTLLINKKYSPNMNRLELISTTNLIFDINDKPLGTGAFGAVYKGVWKCTIECNGKKENNTLDVAIKVVQTTRDISINDIMEESKVMASVRHKHCLRLIGVCLKYEMPCLVTTFVELGSLDKYLKKHRSTLSSLNLLSWAEQIANGMTYLEMRGIIHRDLATRNVLLNSFHLVQITDFGLSHMLQGTETNDEIVITSGKVPIRWLSLETLTSGIYSHKTDVWAFGVTLWEIFTFGERPYEELEVREILTFLHQNCRLSQPEICSIELYNIMLSCWYSISNCRPSFKELMSTLSNFCRHPTFYLNISNDPCLMPHKSDKQRLLSQCSYELHQYPRFKGIYKQQSMDGTISTFIGEYQEDLGEPPIMRQSSIASWGSSKYKFSEDTERKGHLIRYHQSVLSDNLEENENIINSNEADLLDADGYLEPKKKSSTLTKTYTP